MIGNIFNLKFLFFQNQAVPPPSLYLKSTKDGGCTKTFDVTPKILQNLCRLLVMKGISLYNCLKSGKWVQKHMLTKVEHKLTKQIWTSLYTLPLQNPRSLILCAHWFPLYAKHDIKTISISSNTYSSTVCHIMELPFFTGREPVCQFRSGSLPEI